MTSIEFSESLQGIESRFDPNSGLYDAVRQLHFERAETGLSVDGVHFLAHDADQTIFKSGSDTANVSYGFLNVVESGMLLRIFNARLINSESKQIADRRVLLCGFGGIALLDSVDFVAHGKRTSHPEHNVKQILTGICRDGTELDEGQAKVWAMGLQEILDGDEEVNFRKLRIGARMLIPSALRRQQK